MRSLISVFLAAGWRRFGPPGAARHGLSKSNGTVPNFISQKEIPRMKYRHVIAVLAVVKDSKVQKVFPGKPIRFPVLAKGRLDQINIEPRVFVPNQ